MMTMWVWLKFALGTGRSFLTAGLVFAEKKKKYYSRENIFHSEKLCICNRNGLDVKIVWREVQIVCFLCFIVLPYVKKRSMALFYNPDTCWVEPWPANDLSEINRTVCWARTWLLLCLKSTAEFPLLPIQKDQAVR